MKPQEALKLIDQVLANVSGTRADHAKIQEAISVLQKEIVTEESKTAEAPVK